MSIPIAAGLLIVYFMLSIEVYLATYTIGTFHLSFWKFSPTELRILLAIGNLALFYRPQVLLGGETYKLFDVGGAAGVTGMAAMLIIAVATHTKHLYRVERLR
jgi:archaetidylinositol phosphate synthase